LNSDTFTISVAASSPSGVDAYVQVGLLSKYQKPNQNYAYGMGVAPTWWATPMTITPSVAFPGEAPFFGLYFYNYVNETTEVQFNNITVTFNPFPTTTYTIYENGALAPGWGLADDEQGTAVNTQVLVVLSFFFLSFFCFFCFCFYFCFF
jgi:hypothetical protein